MNKNTDDISSVKHVTRKFHIVGRAKQRQRNVQKSVLHVQSRPLYIMLAFFRAF